MEIRGLKTGGFFKGLDKKEKEIYICIYFTAAFALITMATAAAAGFVSAREWVNIYNSRSNTEVVRSVGDKAGELKTMQERLRLIKKQFDNIKYPDRGMMRDSINKDLAAAGFSVQSLTLRDLPLDVVKSRIENGLKGGLPSKRVEAKDLPGMIEVKITGTLPLASMLSFFKLSDRTDRFWYIDELEITPPDGIAEFFSKNFAQLPVSKKKEMFEAYDSYAWTGEPFATVVFSFYTFVKGGE